ncbi:hypothetical protein LTR84_002483 [Exophiala bonariae]|uniref:Uncharacterized protein n=1 Tax=Exophiala bonariae TaxID=1690606 RepID=A0AAV9N9L3_9EURO|nr:hypothetical protein LTR84_002483 [Exophiala bonariae]
MRSLTVFLFALVLMVLGVHSSPERPSQHQQGVDKSCDETKSSTTLKNVGGGVGSTTSHSSTGSTTGIPASTSLTSTITTTITSTRTNTVTVTSPPPSGSCALSSATTGIPITTSPVVPTANNKTVALNTTTSTKHLTNVTNSTHPATSAPNATVPKPTISPTISGFQGAAAALSSQSPASVFALGCLVFMAALLA